jgi:NADH-quinone oxidoreductase subunit C
MSEESLEAQDALKTLGEAAKAQFADAVSDYVLAFGELTLLVERERIVEVMTGLRDAPDFRFHQLLDICGVDYPDRTRRFDVVYHLLSLSKNRRIRVKVQTDEVVPVSSITSVYPNADWYEREAFDLLGIQFDNHPDLRRILTDYGFTGHPLRRDFPMTGYVEPWWDEEQKRIVYRPVHMVQEFRKFDFLSPWEGAKYVLPGDEKAGG